MFQASINTIHGRRMSKSKKTKRLHTRHLDSTQKYHGNLLKTSVLMCQKVDTLYICCWETVFWHCLTRIKTIWRVWKDPNQICWSMVQQLYIILDWRCLNGYRAERQWSRYECVGMFTQQKELMMCILQRIVINASNKKKKKKDQHVRYTWKGTMLHTYMKSPVLTFYTHLHSEPTLRCE